MDVRFISSRIAYVTMFTTNSPTCSAFRCESFFVSLRVDAPAENMIVGGSAEQILKWL
jgi:hypothetical protein